MAKVESGVDSSGRFSLPHVLDELAAKEWEALEAIKTDLCQWLAQVLQIQITSLCFLATLGTGVELCRLANLIQRAAGDTREKGTTFNFQVPMEPLNCEVGARPGSFFARDNTSNFISWCRNLGVEEAVMFESEGLVLHKDEKRVILCLLDVARFAERVGIPPPQLVRMEREIEALETLEQSGLHRDITSENSTSHNNTLKISQAYHKNESSTKQSTSPATHHQDRLSAPSLAVTPPDDNRTHKKRFVSKLPVRRSSRRLANKAQKSSPVLVRSATAKSRKRAREEEEEEGGPHKRTRVGDRGVQREGEEVGGVPSHKRARVEDKGVQREAKEVGGDPSHKGAGVGDKRVQAGGKEVGGEEEGMKKESVDEGVMRRVSECTCQNKIEVTNSGNGKFIVKGASGRKMTIYARLLSDRLMVRVGGGWDTLDHFLLKQDPCRVHFIPTAITVAS